MKRKKITKIILSALIMGAFCFSSLLIPFARSEVVNDTNGYIFLRITQSDPNGVYSPMIWDYNSATDMTGSTIYIYNTDDPTVPMYYPLYVIGYDGFDGSGEQSYLFRGEALTTKFFGDGDDFVFLQDKVLVSEIHILFTFGFEVGPSSALPDEPDFDSIALQFNGHVLNEDLYTVKRYRSSLVERTDTNTNDTFRFRAYRAVYTFNTPLEVTSTDGWDFSFSHTFTWNGYAMQGYEFLTGTSGMYVEYSYQDQYEAGVIGSNNAIVGGFKEQAEEFKDKLNVQKPTNEQVADIIEIAQNNTPQGITQYFDFFDNNSLSADFKRLMLTMMLTSLGIAFCGYALHGKRG